MQSLAVAPHKFHNAYGRRHGRKGRESLARLKEDSDQLAAAHVPPAGGSLRANISLQKQNSFTRQPRTGTTHEPRLGHVRYPVNLHCLAVSCGA